MTPQERLRRALRDSVPDARTDAAGWEHVIARSRSLQSQRRAIGAAAVVVAAAAVSLGVLAATGAFDSGASSRSIVATPTPTAAAEGGNIVASLDDKIAVVSSDDGHVVRTLVSGLESPGGVAVSPDGSTVYYVRSTGRCADGSLTGGLSKVGINGGSPQEVISGAGDPLVSPDGRWLAYSFATCDAPDAQHLGVLDLASGVQRWPLDGTGPEHAVPLAWTADSTGLLYLGGDGDVFRLDGIPQPGAPAANLTPGIGPVTTATLSPDGSLLIARQEAQTLMVQHFDQVPAGIGIRFIAEGTSPSAMSFADGDQLLLQTSDGTLSVQQGSVGNQSTWIAGQRYSTDPRILRRDVNGAAWLPPAPSTSAPTTTAPPTTVATTTPQTGDVPANFEGVRALAADRNGGVFFTTPKTHQLRHRDADGTITVVAGNGEPGNGGDGGQAVDAQLDEPAGIAVGSDGTVYVADRAVHRVRAIAPDGVITTVAGTGEQGVAGTDGPAVDAQLDQPISVAAAPNGDLFVVDAHGVRRIADGTITTIVRSGPGATSGLVVDGQPTALFASAVAVDSDGNVYVGDLSPKLIAKYSPDGTLLRVWKDVHVSQTGLAAAPDGSVVVADYAFSVDRIVGDELIVVERFSLGSIAGLDGPLRPIGIAVADDGTIYVADSGGAAGTSGALIGIAGDGTVTVLDAA